MPNSMTPRSRRARADNAARWTKQQQDAGARRLTVLLPPADSDRLERLVEIYGTATRAICAGLAKLEESK